MKTKFKEILKEQATKEYCEQKFGEYLFGEFKEFYGDELEDNTDYEEQIWNKLTNFIRGEYQGTGKDKILIEAFENLNNCMSEYSKVLKPNSNILYRGINNNATKLVNRFDLIKNNQITYNPHSQVQSWTTANNKDAIMWAATGKDIDRIGILFKKDFNNSNDLLFNTNFTNKLTEKILGTNEYEIIRISNNSIKCDYAVAFYGNWIKTFDNKIDKYNDLIESIIGGNITRQNVENIIKNSKKLKFRL